MSIPKRVENTVQFLAQNVKDETQNHHRIYYCDHHRRRRCHYNRHHHRCVLMIKTNSTAARGQDWT